MSNEEIQIKAKELVEKFLPYVICNRITEDPKIGYAKQCALILCDEMINHCSQVEPWLGTDYWAEVKQAIENL